MEIPESWKIGLICPILKKGDATICENYRGISLLDVTYKILAMMIRKRLSEYADEVVGEYQGGFKVGRSTIDQIFTLKMIQQNSYGQNLRLHILFIDFKRAYHTIDRKMMYQAINNLGIPDKLTRLIKMTLEGSAGKVVVDGSVTEAFPIRKELRQDDPLSTVLFNLVLEKIMRESRIRTENVIY